MLNISRSVEAFFSEGGKGQALLNLALVRIPLRVLKKNVVTNIFKWGTHQRKRALVYYKTDPLFSRRLRNAYVHTNNAEIITIVEILNKYGFAVDLVDRDAIWAEIQPLLSKEYDLYLANCAGNSAPFHNEITLSLKAKCQVFFGAGPEPTESNRLVNLQHDNFDQRNRVNSIRRRLVKGGEFDRRFERIDSIFYVGNEFSEQTYARHKIPSFRIYPSTSPQIYFDNSSIEEKSTCNFLYFGGNGLICKGLDLVLEAFDGLDGVTLDICAPSTEEDFWEFYKPLLRRNPHIRFHGFVPTGGVELSAITAKAGFQIFPGSAEGCATSVVTCMRRGVIPVTTRATGVDLGSYGVPLTEATVEGIRELIPKLAEMNKDDFRQRILGTYIASMEYTPERFQRSFEMALLQTLMKKGVL